MPGLKEIIILPVENEFHICPDCGYELGFHSSFVRAGVNTNNPVRPARDVFRVILICPECGARYDVGWQVSLNEPGGRLVNDAGTPATCVPHGSPSACMPPPPSHDQHPPE
jgi:hypothetical protein